MSILRHVHPLYAAMGTTVFERMSALSRELGAINLGQGFPEGGGPVPLQQAAVRALQDRSAQYPPSGGLPELREAICAFYAARQGLSLQPDEVIVTSGATEAIASAILALVQPGDEVIVFEPAYDAYAPLVRRAGGVPVFVPLAPPRFAYPLDLLAQAIGPRTRMLIVNDPLNPAGTAATEAELAELARLCVAHDLVVLSDEVWEGVRFDGQPHRSILAMPGMRERGVKVGSAGKLFGMTGWKIGWMVASGAIAQALGRAHQFLTFTSAVPLQWAVAEGLGMDDVLNGQHEGWAMSRARLRQGLEQAGFTVLPNAATWFLCVDLAASGVAVTDAAFSDRAVREAGVATIPISALYEEKRGPSHLLRLCFTKPDDALDDAVERLARFRMSLR
ncbi:aminotransferase [uncultured Novosphingobium sp.]|uniref:aminotransferase n=1 Tax=uncultured Novosphingobium sp. TaxID=292277 RepID=UPI003749A675